MKQIPMLFSPDMVRALLEGRKTETRRVFNMPSWAMHADDPTEIDQCVAGRWQAAHKKTGCMVDLPTPQEGDLIWVRESWRPLEGFSNWDIRVHYTADGIDVHIEDGDRDIGDWRFPKAAAKGNVPSIHMPKWASRLTLRVTESNIERLHDIDEAGAIAEGIERLKSGRGFYDPTQSKGVVHLGDYFTNAKSAYARLWNAINGPDAWEQNPWVCVTKFEVIHQNIQTRSFLLSSNDPHSTAAIGDPADLPS